MCMGRNIIIPRSFKQLVCRMLTGTLLFSQLAVAAYACPGTPAAALFDRNQNQTRSAAATAAKDVSEFVAVSSGEMGDQASGTTLSCDQMDLGSKDNQNIIIYQCITSVLHTQNNPNQLQKYPQRVKVMRF